MSIYVVDDNSHICEFLAYLLSSQGHKVHVFAHPDHALEHLRNKRSVPRLLISDFNLPCMNGVELHQAMMKYVPQIKTIIISGRDVMHELGGLPFLQKPFSPDQLLKLVHAYKQEA
ncbi:MAG: response regulator [Zetaproteobacteria bacterium CG12_big_fil_rev_8_21_14_0_65_54_13]|nr:MAG: response regulator [Zetaproteobacteria bacterium CG23_combo_of_CG06-09_8_20_14_all_54_7]PIW51557.1 MAG: response regulator [Zetaproteobacteria bacterium CG12_big_fil_rev_8_21_14_0_65_54_13]PIX53635.1 MAG: response regulator [Zetaproteobacteria bacterium CG_4_10_14_3_um_filter_54_28]PJA27907.1 MAG: response regulator [Zetaproteobacteria bacterium CG_4_9_14_3_um_filter_54_145]